MYLLLYYRKGILFDLPSSSLERLRVFAGTNDLEKVCICQDWDYDIIWKNDKFTLEEVKTLLFHHLNEKIHGSA